MTRTFGVRAHIRHDRTSNGIFDWSLWCVEEAAVPLLQGVGGIVCRKEHRASTDMVHFGVYN
jgi:hypothetical protein